MLAYNLLTSQSLKRALALFPFVLYSSATFDCGLSVALTLSPLVFLYFSHRYGKGRGMCCEKMKERSA